MGGSNQSLFLLTALFAGQGAITGQGSAAVPLLIVGLILAWAAAPAWTELILMYPKRVGGIAATCSEAFRPYNPVLANLTGVCYWWGWIPTCGLTAIFSASAIHEWYLPGIPVTALACGLVLFFTVVNLCGVHWAGRLAVPIATASALLAFVSALAPLVTGQVDWQRASTFHLTVPFQGWFGELTSLMAGLYLIGFAAPAFEAAACHVGETKDPNKNVPRAMFASGLMASVYFIVLPVVWLGTLGSEQLSKDLMLVLGPTFAPVFGSFAKAAAIWFMMFNMFHGPAAAGGRLANHLAIGGRWFVAAYLRAPFALRRAMGRDRGHRRHGHLLFVTGRPDLAGRGGEFYLPDQHLFAERRRLAVTQRPAGIAASLSSAARNDCCRLGRVRHVGHFRDIGLPAIRHDNRVNRRAVCLFRRGALCLARLQ
jgi:two-component system, sensor histidine kinase